MTNNEAIEILKSWDGCIFLEREEASVGYSYNKEISQEAIALAIKALKERQDEWVPVSERLPEETLNSVIGWDAYRERCVFVQYIGGHFQITGRAESFNIVAWQPLPEPYQKGGAE